MTTPHEAAISIPKVGAPAPRFKAQAYPSGTISLDDYIGRKNVILAFYPKDMTPGCTKEMCSFSDDLEAFSSADTEVLGVSFDSVDSHQEFAGRHHLKQPLLADTTGAIARAYGTVKEGGTMANRVLFVIDKTGIIRHIFEGMPTNADLLTVIKALKPGQ